MNAMLRRYFSSRSVPKKGEIWQHVKTGGRYLVLGRAKLQSKRAELDMEECVVYSTMSKNVDPIKVFM